MTPRMDGSGTQAVTQAVHRRTCRHCAYVVLATPSAALSLTEAPLVQRSMNLARGGSRGQSHAMRMRLVETHSMRGTRMITATEQF